MTHKLINTEKTAGWLHIPVQSVEDMVRKGWLVPAVPEQPGYFDATKINQLKKKLESMHKAERWEWSAAAASVGLAMAVWFFARSGKPLD